MKHIVVRHFFGEYAVTIGAGVLDMPLLAEITGQRPALIVTDENVAPHWLEHLHRHLPAAATLVLSAGESAKTLQNAERIWAMLAEQGFGRDVVLIALGGGVIGDMAGYAAAGWMRGIDFIQVPTSLLAQVDASIGGKTGVNMPAGKNLIGAFHQPRAVLIDIRTLNTLPAREFAAGFAEIVKAALLADAGFLEWLEGNSRALRARDAVAMEYAIHRSCEIKAAIVTHDERETGKRMLLNLGHTFAHALETTTGYARFLHGEAVAIGLVLAAALSETHCGLSPALRPRLIRLLDAFDLPTRLPSGVDRIAMLAAMRIDKKHTHAHWRLVLLDAPGRAQIREFSDNSGIRTVLEAG